MLSDALKLTVNEPNSMKCVVITDSKEEVSGELEISNISNSITIVGKEGAYKTDDQIKGMADNGKMFITSPIKINGFTVGFPGITTEQYFFDQIIFLDAHNWEKVDDLKDVKIQNANVSLSSLTKWLPRNYFVGGYPKPQDKILKIKNVVSPYVSWANITYKGINFDLGKHEHLTSVVRYNEIEVKITEQIGLRFTSPVGISQIEDIANIIKKFFTLLWDRPTNIMNINQVGNKQLVFNLLPRQREIYDDKSINPNIFMFSTYDCLARAIKKYFQFLESPIVNLVDEYLTALIFHLNTDMRLIQMCQGIEAAIKKDICLKEKIKEVFEPFAESFNVEKDEVERFAEKIKNNRVNITHGKNRPEAFCKDELVPAVATLGVACHLYIFKQLGIDEDYHYAFADQMGNIKANTGIDPWALFKLKKDDEDEDNN